VDDPGVVVLSRFAGAARECEAALIVNPYDADAVANAIARALSMPIEERRERHKSIMRVLTQNDSRFWGDKFLTALELTFDEMSMFADLPTSRPITKVRQKTA
jgi:trehalose 6-phosphate synthase